MNFLRRPPRVGLAEQRARANPGLEDGTHVGVRGNQSAARNTSGLVLDR